MSQILGLLIDLFWTTLVFFNCKYSFLRSLIAYGLFIRMTATETAKEYLWKATVLGSYGAILYLIVSG